MSEVLTEVVNGVGRITLARPRAMNALSLDMIRQLTGTLRHWAEDPAVLAAVIRGSAREPDPASFGHFCAGGDIRFFHQAALAGDPRLEDFFTEEYTLNHLIHAWPKPYVALMDGVVMGGGMGVSQGAALRIVTQRSRLAMPETLIGLFPDVGGGWFLSRCPGHVGEYLALTGHTLHAADAIAAGLADRFVPAERLHGIWQALEHTTFGSGQAVLDWLHGQTTTDVAPQAAPGAEPAGGLDHHRIQQIFGLPDVKSMFRALEDGSDEWSAQTLATLRARSPLMLHVVLEQVRRARSMSLADDLRLERGLVRHCFWLRPGVASETVEGIRALAVDKDHQPRWNPARVEDVSSAEVDAFFVSPWPDHAHPLRALA